MARWQGIMEPTRDLTGSQFEKMTFPPQEPLTSLLLSFTLLPSFLLSLFSSFPSRETDWWKTAAESQKQAEM